MVVLVPSTAGSEMSASVSSPMLTRFGHEILCAASTGKGGQVQSVKNASRQWMYRGGRQRRVAAVSNRATAALASAGLTPRRLVTLEVRGRRSGRRVALPVVVADYAGARYLVSMLGANANWVRNVKAAGGEAVLRHGHRELVRLTEIAVSVRPPILRRYVELAPGARAHFPVDEHGSIEAFAEIAADYPVFRIDRPLTEGAMETTGAGRLSKFGATRAGTWVIARVISPVQRWVIEATGGRVSLTKRPVLLLTARGRRSGRPRTVPLFFLQEGHDLVVCNVRPPTERANPWPLNVRANPEVTIRTGRRVEQRIARDAQPDEVERLWPRLVALWPAYQRFYAQTHERAIFVLEAPRA